MSLTRFDFIPTALNGLLVVQRKAISDERGFLSRFYCSEEFGRVGMNKPIAQINHTFTSKKGTVRGLHFQHTPHGDMKLVSCLKGEVWDVVVDLRSGSPTFLQWSVTVLSGANRNSLLIPEGFAHGFQTLADDCELIYLHTSTYQPKSEGALNIADPLLSIAWPLAISEISERDQNHQLIANSFQGITV
jgi:dTDP-4-dehydrorhamnose 3,5-epimerase